MKLTPEARRQAREIFDLTLVDGRPDRARLNLAFGEISEKKPRDYFQILKALVRLVRLDAASRHVLIESAVPLGPEKTRAFEAGLKSRFGGLTTEFRRNPALIGGLRVQIGSDVWDGSIRARLDAIKNLS